MSRPIPKAPPLVIQGVGVFTPAGTTPATAFGSVRLGLKFFEELPWRDAFGTDTVGARTPLDLSRVQGGDRLVTLAALALAPCVAAPPLGPPAPLLLCLPVPAHRYAPAAVLRTLCEKMGAVLDPASSRVFPSGRAAIFDALEEAARLLAARAATQIYLGGVDSLVDHDAFDGLLRAGRLKTSTEEGLIAGEGAVFLRIGLEPGRGRAAEPGALAAIVGTGVAQEPRTREAEEPNVGEGLAAAARAALDSAGVAIADVGTFVHDAAGDRFGLREAAMALVRLRPRTEPPPAVWTPASVVGEIGAAYGPFALALAAHFIDKKLGDSEATLVLATGDEDARGAVVVTAAGQSRGGR